MKVFTNEQLARYNGKNGLPAYVGHEGKVYDMSNSLLWKDGNHQVLHIAGTDLIASMKQAPHGDELLKRFPVVGIIPIFHEKK